MVAREAEMMVRREDVEKRDKCREDKAGREIVHSDGLTHLITPSQSVISAPNATRPLQSNVTLHK